MANTLSLARTDRITGSRVAGVLGVSPYRKREHVLREMLREKFFYPPEFDGNFITEFGQEHEVDGIADYELLTGQQVSFTGEEQKTIVGGPGGIFAITPDGLIYPKVDNRLATKPAKAVEVKCPWRAQYTSLWERPDYEQQCRLIAETTEVEAVDFAVWRQSGTTITEMYRDRDRDGQPFDWLHSKLPDHEDTVISEIEAFLEEYAQLCELDEDDPKLKRYLVNRDGERTDHEWLAAVATYSEYENELARAARALADSREELVKLAGSQSTKGGGLHLVYTPPKPASAGGGKGAVSYKDLAEAIAKQAGIEITEALKDQHRGKPSGGGSGTPAKYAIRHYDD